MLLLLFTVKEDKKTLKKTGCLVVVILTHGNQDGVFATDRLMKIKTLMDHFSAENCPELMLKPKVFIFQVKYFKNQVKK